MRELYLNPVHVAFLTADQMCEVNRLRSGEAGITLFQIKANEGPTLARFARDWFLQGGCGGALNALTSSAKPLMVWECRLSGYQAQGTIDMLLLDHLSEQLTLTCSGCDTERVWKIGRATTFQRCVEPKIL